MSAATEGGRRRANPHLILAVVGVVSHWLAALALWFIAGYVAWRECLDNAYGMAVEGGGVSATEQGCVVDIPTRSGHMEALLPTLDSGFAAAAVVVAALGALCPLILLAAATREIR